MKLSELITELEDVYVALALDSDEVWSAYIINKRNDDLKNVLIQSFGHGEIDAWPIKTATLRHFIELVPAHDFQKIENVFPDVFSIENNYWVSCYIKNTIFDKKFIFKPNSINIENSIYIPELNMQGIII